jgi:Domain of unknown function DUF29
MAIDDLYERDFYVWTQEQAAALRAAAKAGGRSNAIDWERVAEEVEDLGKRDLREASSYIALIIEHMLKLAWTRREEPKAGWRAEIIRFQGVLELVMTAALRAKIEADMDRLHRIALRDANAAFDVHEPDAPRDETLQWTLDEVLG